MWLPLVSSRGCCSSLAKVTAGWQIRKLPQGLGHRSFTASAAQPTPSFGLLFDIDGVIVRGKKPIPGAAEAFQKLVGRDGRMTVPVVFVTNAGNCVRQTRATELSRVLGVEVLPEQVILSHSPLLMLEQFHDKCVLMSGQGPVAEIAKDQGFRNVVTINDLRMAYPLLDMVDHNRRPKNPTPVIQNFPAIEAVILLGEPVRWETSLQLILDVLLSNGRPTAWLPQVPYPHIPVLACNMDLLWMAEAKNPRDNPMADIYGANLYNRFLKSNQGRSEDGLPQSCRSILVCTGVYNNQGEVPSDTRESVTQTVFHGHRDFRLDPTLVEASHIVKDVEHAVNLVLKEEGWVSESEGTEKIKTPSE
ncbi:hypothetical protein XENTR_v10007739 [Xenopus tropicalis]|nr:hypothetical protein XENTR_v10007739 [Xenopus tropicalis]